MFCKVDLRCVTLKAATVGRYRIFEGFSGVSKSGVALHLSAAWNWLDEGLKRTIVKLRKWVGNGDECGYVYEVILGGMQVGRLDFSGRSATLRPVRNQ